MHLDVVKAVEENQLHFVVNKKTARFYVESPEEALEHEYDERFACFRVFPSEDMAAVYRDTVAVYAGEELEVVSSTFPSIYSMLPILNQRAEASFEAPLAVKLCTMKPGEFPRCLDTVWVPHTLH